MKRKYGIIAGGLLMLLTNTACASAHIRCAGCAINEAYSDPRALALVKAAVDGDAKEVERLMAAGANPSHLEEGKVPMLLWTLCAENVKGFEALLKAGADPNLGGTGHGRGDGKSFGTFGGHWYSEGSIINKGWSATVMAAAMKRPEFLRLALQHGGNPDAKKGQRGEDRPLLQAAVHGHFDNVKMLIEAGADINAHDDQEKFETAPENAVRSLFRFDIAVWLLEHGYSYKLHDLAEGAELSYIPPDALPHFREMQPYKEKLIDMLKERGVTFPASKLIKKGLTTRQIPDKDIQDLIYGRRNVQDYPKRPGMEEEWP